MRLSSRRIRMSSNLDDYQDRYNDPVRSGFSLFRDAITKLIRNQIKIQIQFFYATLATEIHPNTKAQAAELKSIVMRTRGRIAHWHLRMILTGSDAV